VIVLDSFACEVLEVEVARGIFGAQRINLGRTQLDVRLFGSKMLVVGSDLNIGKISHLRQESIACVVPRIVFET